VLFFDTTLAQVVGIAVALVIGITFHEFSHAFTADQLGDPRPRALGRVSLSPTAHIDPVGAIVFVLAGFGWGKPVQFNPHNLKVNQAIGSAAVSFAGPLANILLAMALYQGASLGLARTSPQMAEFVGDALRMNIGLAAFNLLPIPPLDGSWILSGMLPPRLRDAYERIRPYGFMIFLLLVVTSVTDVILTVPLLMTWGVLQLVVSAMGFG
jgi:Zn-dependent protease